ncbi:MAG: hypothetical protein KA243_02045 [Candidatus Aminicenantes bacterium]|nr:hypothetical protein [Candidatus Aminicenantes bacterium]NLH77184.1 hypothetical protein [Acidobacteriota bacterium]
MGHMRKQMLIQQKASFEQTLKERLAALAAKKDKAAKPEKDTIVRKLQAQVRAIGKRIAAIEANEKRTEDLAKMKAAKLAAPKEEAPKAEKAKKGGEEGKAKKPKAEKPKTEKPAKPKAEAPKEEPKA